MPTALTLSHSDLALVHSVCETRYDLAFLIYDRTGAICQENKERYPDMKIVIASPGGTTFTSGKYNFAIEQNMSRVVCAEMGHDPKGFGETSSAFFEIVFRLLEIKVLNRIGLRQMYLKTCNGSDEASELARKLKLQPGNADRHFGIKSAPREAVYRWESGDQGRVSRL